MRHILYFFIDYQAVGIFYFFYFSNILFYLLLVHFSISFQSLLILLYRYSNRINQFFFKGTKAPYRCLHCPCIRALQCLLTKIGWQNVSIKATGVSLFAYFLERTPGVANRILSVRGYIRISGLFIMETVLPKNFPLESKAVVFFSMGV